MQAGSCGRHHPSGAPRVKLSCIQGHALARNYTFIGAVLPPLELGLGTLFPSSPKLFLKR